MSHLLYKPSTSGKQNLPQAQFGSSIRQMEMDLGRTLPHFGSGSSFSSSFGTPENPCGAITQFVAQPVSYRLDRSQAILAKDMACALNVDVATTGEEVKGQHVHQGAHFANPPRHTFTLSDTGATSYLTSAASQGYRQFHVESGSSSLNWLSNYIEAPTSNLCSSLSSSAYLSSDASTEKECEMQVIIRRQDNTVPDKLMYSESSFPRYTPQVVTGILVHNEISSIIPKSREVIDHGCPGKYSTEVADEIGRTDYTKAKYGERDGMWLTDTSHSKEAHQKSTFKVESSTPAPSCDRNCSVNSVTSQKSSVVSPSSDPAKQLQNQPSHDSKPIFTPFALRKRVTNTKILKSGFSRYFTEPEADDHWKPKIDLFSAPVQDVKSTQPHLLLTGSNGDHHNNESKTPEQTAGDAEQKEKQTKQREPEMQPITALRKQDSAMPDKLGSPESSFPTYTPEMATRILDQIGLEKHDLEHLLIYPEDQITAENLPLILRQIRLQRTKSATKAVRSGTCSDTQPTTDVKELAGLWNSLKTEMVSPSSDPEKQLQTQLNQNSKAIVTSFSKVSKPLKPEADCRLTPKNQPSSSSVQDGKPAQSRLVPIGSNENHQNNDRTRSQEQASKIAQHVKKQQARQQMKQRQKQKNQQQPQNHQHKPKQPLLQTGQALMLKNALFAKSVLEPFTRGEASGPPAPIQPVSTPINSTDVFLPPSSKQPVTIEPLSRHLPTPAMIEDNAAVKPRTFPHTCCHSVKECVSIKSTSLHLDRCRLPWEQFPECDTIRKGALRKDAELSPSTSAKRSQDHHKKGCSRRPPAHLRLNAQRETSRSRSRSQSPSPCPRCSTNGGGHKSSVSSRSHSPVHPSSRCRKSKSRSGSRSSSRSPRPRWSSKCRKEKRSGISLLPNSSKHKSRHSRQISACYRSRSRTLERQFPSRRRDEKWSSLRGGHESSSSTQTLVAQQQKSISAERLAQRLLEPSGVQSLSERSDLKAVVKVLVPALLDELAKKESKQGGVDEGPSSSSHTAANAPSSSDAAKKESSCSLHEVKTSHQKTGASSSGTLKDTVSKKEKIKPPVQKNTSTERVKTHLTVPLEARKNKELSSETKMLISKERRVSTKLKVKSVEAIDGTAEVPLKTDVVKKDASKMSKSLKKSPITGHSKQKATHQSPGRNAEETAHTDDLQMFALEATQKVKAVETTAQKDPVPQTQKDPVLKHLGSFSEAESEESVLPSSTQVHKSVVPKVAALAVKKCQMMSSYTSGPATSLTVGEMMETSSLKERLNCTELKNGPPLQVKNKWLLIDNLPEFYEGCYTEADVANLLRPFGFNYKHNHIYVIPQKRMALLFIPRLEKPKTGAAWNCITLNGSKLSFHTINRGFPEKSFRFYKSLMKLMDFNVLGQGQQTIYIQNISPSEIKDLRKVLSNIGPVRNYLPMLNKVFVEFESAEDVDQLGVCYSLLKQGMVHRVFRMEIPHNPSILLQPTLTEGTMPNSTDVVAKETLLTTNILVPEGSTPPFWVTMTTSPYVFPTVLPWFMIPDYLTIRTTEDIEKAHPQASEFSTVMLTGLQEINYKQEDVTKLVCKHFSEQNLQSLDWNVIVLPLQRRAFVFFKDWEMCCTFVQKHIDDSVQHNPVHVHLVLQDMSPGSNEEVMYSNLLKWSNSSVPVLNALEERLLCVEVSEMSITFLIKIMEQVASIASFLSYFPLANKIYIEMAESSSVSKVVEHLLFMYYTTTETIWFKLRHAESLKSLKIRRHMSGNTQEPVVVDAKPPTAEYQSQFKEKLSAHQTVSPDSAKPASTVRPAISESTTAGPAANISNDETLRQMNDCTKSLTFSDYITLSLPPDFQKSAQTCLGKEKPKQSPVSKSELKLGADRTTTVKSKITEPPVQGQKLEITTKACTPRYVWQSNAREEDGKRNQIPNDQTYEQMKEDGKQTQVVDGSNKNLTFSKRKTTTRGRKYAKWDQQKAEKSSEELHKTSKAFTQIQTDKGQDSDQKQTENKKVKKDKTQSHQNSKIDVATTKEEEHSNHVISSVEDQSASDHKEEIKNDAVTSPREDGPPRSSYPRTRTSKGEEVKSQKKRYQREYKTRSKNSSPGKDKNRDEGSDVQASVEEESVQESGTKTLTSDCIEEERLSKILVSVEDEAAAGEPTMRRSARARREGTKEHASNEETKNKETSTRKRSTPARDLQGAAPLKQSMPKKKNEISDSVVEEVTDDQPTRQRRRGRPKKEIKSTTKRPEDEKVKEKIPTLEVSERKERKEKKDGITTKDGSTVVETSEQAATAEDEEPKSGSFKPESSMTVDEMEENEGVKEDGEESKKTWSSMKRKRDEAGQEMVVPMLGYFCELCSVFYLNESVAVDLHCCSQTHYDNLQKYYRKQQKLSVTLMENSPVLHF